MIDTRVEWDTGVDVSSGYLLGTAYDSQRQVWIALIMRDDGSTVEIYPILTKMRRQDCEAEDDLVPQPPRPTLTTFERRALELVRSAEEARGPGCNADIVQCTTNILDRFR